MRLNTIRHDQGGFALVEILVSSILLVIVSVGVFGAFDAATRSTAQERHRARAHAIAEADLSRMRALRISDLSNLNETRNVTQDGLVYTIVSQAEFITDATGTASCETGIASADYLKISSTVSWQSIGSRPPVYASSIVAPPNGSVSADSGSLAISVEDSQNVGIPGVGVSGNGPASFNGTTGPDGCVIFGNLPEGSYTVAVSGVASGMVDRDGNEPGPIQTSVVGESTNTVVLQYDEPGFIPVNFTTIPYGGGPQVTSSADSVIAYNTGMTAARAFGTPGTPASQIDASSLFPFSSDYALYAGTCEGDNPNPNNDDPPPAPAAILSALVPPGGSPPPPTTIQLPALHLTVWSGTNSSPGTVVSGARVRISDTRCSDFKRTFTTDSSGRLPDPGMPFSDYVVCADNGSSRNYVRLSFWPYSIQTVSLNDASDLINGTVRNIYLQGNNWQSGICP